MQFLRDQVYMIIPPTPRSFKWALPSGFPTKTLYASLLLLIRATYHPYPYLKIRDLITQVIFDIQCRSWALIMQSPPIRHETVPSGTQIPSSASNLRTRKMNRYIYNIAVGVGELPSFPQLWKYYQKTSEVKLWQFWHSKSIYPQHRQHNLAADNGTKAPAVLRLSLAVLVL